MAYVDHAFSISDEDIMMEGPYVVHNRAPSRRSHSPSPSSSSAPSASSSAPSWPQTTSAAIAPTGRFSRSWAWCSSYRGSTTRGSRITPTRVTKASPLPTFPPCERGFRIVVRIMRKDLSL
uniref:Uncharacterized protein n=1 Tax=Ananas comosus var. bracteatus TaxID=296719 RepID=A0A6V7P492_ANACO|nr:unnamed protein product [Ananas comosus var. bracteatus]